MTTRTLLPARNPRTNRCQCRAVTTHLQQPAINADHALLPKTPIIQASRASSCCLLSSMMTYLLLLLLYGQTPTLPMAAQRSPSPSDPSSPLDPTCVSIILVFQRCHEALAGLSSAAPDYMDPPSCDSGLAIFWTPQQKLETLTITEPTVHPRIQRLWMCHLPWDPLRTSIGRRTPPPSDCDGPVGVWTFCPISGASVHSPRTCAPTFMPLCTSPAFLLTSATAPRGSAIKPSACPHPAHRIVCCASPHPTRRPPDLGQRHHCLTYPRAVTIMSVTTGVL